MGIFLRFWNKLIGKPASSDQVMRREVWTRDVVRMMFFVVLTATGAILIGVIGGVFDLAGTIPIYLILGATAFAHFGVRHNGWRWARFLPVLICLVTGGYFSYQSGFTNNILFYTLAILLAGMLFGKRGNILVAFISFLAYTTLASHLNASVLYENVADVLTIFFLLLGLTFLLTYFDNSLSRVITDLISGNKKLQDEISLREKAEVDRQKQTDMYVRLAENTSDLVTEMAPDGTINYISPSHYAILGYTSESLVGTSIFDIVHPDDRASAFAAENQARTSLLHTQVRLRIRHADGHYITLEVFGSPMVNDKNELSGYILSSRDISRQILAEETLKQSEEKFRNIIESIPLGIQMFTVNGDRSLTLAGYNPAASSILGLDHAPLMGKSISEAFPSLYFSEITEAFLAVALDGGHWNLDKLVINFDQLKRTFEIQAFQYSPGKMVAIFEDITEKIASEEALRNSEEIFSKAFLTSPDAININRIKDGMYISINQGFTNMTGYSPEDAVGKTSLELDIWVDPADRTELVRGLMKDGVVNNLEAGFRFKDGTVKVGLMSARVIEINHEQCILSITRDISERNQAEQDLKNAHAHLEEAYNETLEGWVRALELREHATADHSRRVVDFTMGMALRMGITGDDLVNAMRGALLHDIGKMGVPDSILLKPGSLTMEEWTIMRYHPVYARTLLEEIAYLVPAIDIPYSHHERWDGSGYPRGISGETIPLCARIFAVIDVYDALISNRPYRPAWSEPDVRQYLIDQKGSQFDPVIVDEFLALLAETEPKDQGHS